MNRTTKLHRYAILWLHSQGFSNEDISKEVKLSVEQVNRTISQNSTSLNKEDKTPTKTEQHVKTTNSKSKNLMITDSNAKKFKVAIMTKDASMLNDELKKNNTQSPSTKDYIYRPDNG